MKTIKKKKTFDAVKMMREIRTKISKETADMTFAELRAYIEKRLKSSDLKPIGE